MGCHHSSSMPTLKRRLNITLSSELSDFLVNASKRDDIPEATKAAEMLRLAMELEEDVYDSALADRHMKDPAVTYVSHEDFWQSARSYVSR